MYTTMWKRYQRGQLTLAGWINFANWHFECVMNTPQYVAMMRRMKDM